MIKTINSVPHPQEIDTRISSSTGSKPSLQNLPRILKYLLHKLCNCVHLIPQEFCKFKLEYNLFGIHLPLPYYIHLYTPHFGHITILYFLNFTFNLHYKSISIFISNKSFNLTRNKKPKPHFLSHLIFTATAVSIYPYIIVTYLCSIYKQSVSPILNSSITLLS